jgi:hypothetical protein
VATWIDKVQELPELATQFKANKVTGKVLAQFNEGQLATFLSGNSIRAAMLHNAIKALKGSHHITSHHITSHHITSHHITSHHITSHHITSHHITSHTALTCPIIPMPRNTHLAITRLTITSAITCPTIITPRNHAAPQSHTTQSHAPQSHTPQLYRTPHMHVLSHAYD